MSRDTADGLTTRSRHLDSMRAAIPRRPDPARAPLSFAQQRLWFLDQLRPGTGLYNMSSRIRLKGELRIDALRSALDALVSRHEALRTTFPVQEGEPYQLIGEAIPVELPVLDLTSMPEPEREDRARRLAAEEARRPFNLARGPLIRARLLRMSPAEHVLLLSLHHIVSDGWSMGVLVRELGAAYKALAANLPVELPALALQYADYAAWQRGWLQGQALERQLAYWRQQFRSEPPALPLAPAGARPRRERHAGARVKFTLPQELLQRLEVLGRQEGATLFMTMLASFKALLCRYTGQEDIVVGSPTAGRNRVELEQLIGFFVNTLALRSDLRGDPSFRELVRRVRDVSLGAYEHQDVPFERVVQEVQPDRDLDRNPLFQAFFSLEHAGRSERRLAGVTLAFNDVEREHSKFDLTLVLVRRPDEVRGTFIYSAAVFEDETVTRMADHYRTLLESMAARPDLPLSGLSLLPESELHDLAVTRNATSRTYPPPACVHELFERQAARTPEAIAASGDGRDLTFAQLNRAANQLAGRLRSLGVGPETRVGLCAGPSLELLVGMLGTLKAGGAYLPLDPSLPRDRLCFMLADAGAEVLLLGSGGPTPEWFEPLPTTTRMVHGLELGAPASGGSGSDSNPNGGAVPDSLAYVMYTSGSTGRPKGVAAHHGAVVNFVRGAAEAYRLTTTDRVLHLASVSSDISTDELFPAWSSGAAVVLGGRLSPGADLTEYLRDRRVTAVSLPTAFWHAWVQELHQSGQTLPPDLRLVIVGGEQMQATLLARWHELAGSRVRILNTYGPTEATVQATLHEPDSSPSSQTFGRVPIGRPVPNVRVYVVDQHLNLLPSGAVGELCIGGAGVSRGYLGRPGQTAAAFVPDPFAPEPGGRLYRTGDRVRFRLDGELEFLGRMDHQVKVRGYRIEPGEIEAVLAQHPEVGECVVAVKETPSGERRLVAYVVPVAPKQPPGSAELAAYLAGKLPSYMLPTDYVPLAALPVTPTNKVDRIALPDPNGGRPDLQAAYVGARTPLEEVIAGIWASVLKLDRVGMHDDFFSLGGHSLTATQVVSRIRSACGCDLPLSAMFDAPTVARIAERVQALRETAAAPSPPLTRVSRERYRVSVPGPSNAAPSGEGHG